MNKCHVAIRPSWEFMFLKWRNDRVVALGKHCCARKKTLQRNITRDYYWIPQINVTALSGCLCLNHYKGISMLNKLSYRCDHRSSAFTQMRQQLIEVKRSLIGNVGIKGRFSASQKPFSANYDYLQARRTISCHLMSMTI